MVKRLAKMKFTIILSVILIIAAGFILFSQASKALERVKPYYSGDAIGYNGRLFIASTDMKGVEIFEVRDNKIYLLKKFSSFDAVYSDESDFNGVIFKVENGLLYLYLSDGRYIYKYDLKDINNPILLRKIMDNSYDWFTSLGRCGDNLVSRGTKGVKIWNNDLNVIYSNKTTNLESRNIQLEPACEFIFNINSDKIEIFNRFTNYNFPAININSKENHYRKILFDNNNSSFYLVDDSSLKQLDYQGKVLQNFNHISRLGYDVVSSADQKYIYFSDGIGVVKLDKTNLQPVKWVYTTNLGGKNGWAMSMSAVDNGGGEKLIVFNNSNILVLNENLEKIDSYTASETNNSPLEPAVISINKSAASAGEWVSVNGRGFVPLENIKISLAGNFYYTQADNYGQFTYTIKILPVKSDLYSLTADGVSSKRTFSVGFRIIN